MKPRLRRRAKRTSTAKTDRQQGRLSREVRELWGESDGEELTELVDSRSSGRPPRRRKRAAATGSRLSGENLSRGRVVAIASGACTVDDGDRLLHCQLPSRLAARQQASVAIGDRVGIEATERGWRVQTVAPRTTFLARPDPRNHRLERVIAANVDLVVHVAAVKEPALRVQLIDRFLVAISRGGATPLLCINKIELVATPGERSALEVRLAPYRRLGIGVVFCSARLGTGLAELREKLSNKCSVLVGHSGVGKSSLLNALIERSTVAQRESVATGEVTSSSGKGQHTTTRSSFHQLDSGIEIIDTPGIREFGLWRIDPRDLELAFVDIAELARQCRFSNCSHLTEPDCAVAEAIDSGSLDAHRLAAFHRLSGEIDVEPE